MHGSDYHWLTWIKELFDVKGYNESRGMGLGLRLFIVRNNMEKIVEHGEDHCLENIELLNYNLNEHYSYSHGHPLNNARIGSGSVPLAEKNLTSLKRGGGCFAQDFYR